MARIAAGAALFLPALVAGHLLAHALASPIVHGRVEPLQDSGHSALPFVVCLALAALPLVLGLGVVTALGGAGRLSSSRLAALMGCLQSVTFLAVEVLERGAAVATVLFEPAVLVGAVLQVPTAVLVVRVLALLGPSVRRGSRWLRGLSRSPLPKPVGVHWPLPSASLRTSDVRSHIAQRAPPRSVPA